MGDWEEWDPLAVDDSEPGPAPPAAGGTVWGHDDTHPIEGSTTRIVKRDLERSMMETIRTVREAEPWQTMPDPKPDLSWHVPRCSLEAWPHKDLRCELGGSVARFTLSRALDGNRLTGALVAALTDALFLLHQRTDIRVAIFAGEGKIFCAGGAPLGDGDGAFELGEQSAEVKASRERLLEKARKASAFPDGQENLGRVLMTRLWHVWATVPQFTICVCNGSSMGDGLGIVSCCDYAVGMKGSFFVVSEVMAGVVPAGLAPFIINKIGAGMAKHYFCTGENMTAERACELGLLDEVVASVAEANKIVAKMCTQLTICGPRTVAFAKEICLGVQGQQLIEPLMFYTGMMLHRVTGSDEAKAAKQLRPGEPRPWEKTPITPLK